jgi:F-type H+-transporting ATPase subunit b
MNFSWWTFALQAANFLILIWLLQRFLFRPAKSIVARRKEEISRVLTEASQEKESALRLMQEIEVKRSLIDVERQKMIDEERAQLSAQRKRIIEEARGEAEKVRDQALIRLDEERAAASNELFERTVALATNLTERLLHELAVPSIEQPFLERVVGYLDQLAEEERAKLFPRMGATVLFVTTAHPLGIEEQSQWREQLAKRLGAAFSIQFSADPALIAGTVITFPHAILRFNWRDTLTTALKQIRTDGQPG